MTTQRRTFLRGVAGLFVAATLPVPTNLLANDKECDGEIEILREQVVDCQTRFGHYVQWMGRRGNVYATCAAAVSNWNDLDQREMARREAKLAFRLHFNRKATT